MPSISSTLVKVRKPTWGEIPPENYSQVKALQQEKISIHQVIYYLLA